MQSTKEWSSLIDPDRAPDVIRVEHNGENGITVTSLMKIKRDDGSFQYIGTPTKNGRAGRYNLIIEPNGFIIGSAAMNFVANGGWRPGDQKPALSIKKKHRAEFVRKFISAAIVHQGMDNEEDLLQRLAEQTGFNVSVGEITAEEQLDLGLIGVKAHLVELALSRGVRFEIDVAQHVSRWVQTSYATTTKGQWDAESSEVATTSALGHGQVALMKRHGLRFQKALHARKVLAK